MDRDIKEAPVNKQFDIKAIKAEQDAVSEVMNKKFETEITLLEDIISIHIKIMGFLYNQYTLKEFLGSKLDKNIVMNNAIGNHVYLSLSILELLKRGYYGSARVLLRQSFEMLMAAKYYETNDFKQEWDDGNTRIGPIFKYLEAKGKRTDGLKTTYRELCKFSHATPFAQQLFRLPQLDEDLGDISIDQELLRQHLQMGANKAYSNSQGKVIIYTDFYFNMSYTLDLFFVNLCMLFHLNNLYHRKTRDFYMGYYRDIFGSNESVKKIKQEFNNLKSTYLGTMKKREVHKDGIITWKKVIRQYTLNWE